MTQDRMLDFEIKGELQKIGMCVRVLQGVNVSGLLHEFSMNDTLGPLFDPTGWMRIHDNSRKNEQVVRALGVFLAEVEKVWPKSEWENEQPTS